MSAITTQSATQGEEGNRQLNEARANEQEQELIKQVDEWEYNSRNRIQEIAAEARRVILKHTTERVSEIETKLIQLADQLRQWQEVDSFVSKNASQCQEELARLSQQMVTPSNISVREVVAPIVTKIHVDIPGDTNGTVVAGGNGEGNRLDQFNNPTHVFVDQDHSVYVSDYNNHRVTKWVEGAKEGVVVAGGQGKGSSLKQLNYPRGIVVDRLGSVYVADYNNHRVVRWLKGATRGSVVVGENGAGAQPNQLNGCWDLSFDRQGNLLLCDLHNHRVQKFNINSSSNQ